MLHDKISIWATGADSMHIEHSPRTVLILESEDDNQEDGIRDRDAEGDEVVEGPVSKLRELRCDERRGESTSTCKSTSMLSIDYFVAKAYGAGDN